GESRTSPARCRGHDDAPSAVVPAFKFPNSIQENRASANDSMPASGGDASVEYRLQAYYCLALSWPAARRTLRPNPDILRSSWLVVSASRSRLYETCPRG